MSSGMGPGPGLGRTYSAASVVLVGDETAYTDTSLLYDSGYIWYNTSSFTASASGSADKAYLYLYDWSNSGNVVLAVWGSTGTLLGTTAAIPSSAGTGWISASFASKPTITSGQQYFLGFLANNYLQPYGGSTTWGTQRATATYPTTANIAPGSDGAAANRNFAIYLKS